MPTSSRHVSSLKCDQLLFTKACRSSRALMDPELSWSTDWINRNNKSKLTDEWICFIAELKRSIYACCYQKTGEFIDGTTIVYNILYLSSRDWRNLNFKYVTADKRCFEWHCTYKLLCSAWTKLLQYNRGWTTHDPVFKVKEN